MMDLFEAAVDHKAVEFFVFEWFPKDSPARYRTRCACGLEYASVSFEAKHLEKYRD